MKLLATGTNCSTTMMNSTQASNMGDTGPEKENRRARHKLNTFFNIYICTVNSKHSFDLVAIESIT